MKTKNLFIFLLLLGFIFIFTGCSKAENEKKNPDNEKEENSVTEEPEDRTLTWTNGEKISLWDSNEEIPYFDQSIGQDMPSLTPYMATDNPDGKVVIIIPGGGYAVHSDMETEKEAAAELNNNNISALILDYRVTPYTKDAIMSDAFRAIRFVRYYAESFHIDPAKITVMGFSAGGHLVAMTMEHYNDKLDTCGDNIDKESARPDAGVLCYPVISLKDEYVHKTSRKNFLGEDNENNKELQEQYSGELQVTKDTPPAFIWHTKKDKGVPYQNSELFASALEAKGVPCELHLYEIGNHGLGLAKGIKGAEEWFGQCVRWLNEIYAE